MNEESKELCSSQNQTPTHDSDCEKRCVCSGPPSSFVATEIEDFCALVLAGGEVQADGLEERVRRAKNIAFVRQSACLVGVAGLKVPAETYRTRIASSARAAISENEYPYELGWVFIMPGARGRRHSRPLCDAALSAAEKKGVFATSRDSNKAMHSTLERLGFERSGKSWPSKLANEQIWLYLKRPESISAESRLGA